MLRVKASQAQNQGLRKTGQIALSRINFELRQAIIDDEELHATKSGVPLMT